MAVRKKEAAHQVTLALCAVALSLYLENEFYQNQKVKIDENESKILQEPG